MALPVLALLVHVLPLAAHPSLFYDGADVPRLRAPATAPQKEIRAALLAGASYASNDPASLGYEMDRGPALFTFAADCAITGDPTICDGAHRWLLFLLDQSQWEGTGTAPVDFLQAAYVTGVSMAYDVLSDDSGAIPASARLTAAERSAVRARLTVEAGRIADQSASGAHPSWWAKEYSQNHNWVDMSALAVAAAVLNGENKSDPTCAWFDAVIANFQEVGKRLAPITDGTWHEGYSYEGSSVAGWLGFAIPFARARRPNAVTCGAVAAAPDFALSPWFRAFPHYRAVSSLPGRMHQAILTHGDFFGWSSDEVVMALRFAAAHNHDGEAEWLAEQQLLSAPHDTYGYEQQATAIEYLVYDPATAATPPTARSLYLADLAGDIERSGYDANALVLGLKAGAFGGLANWNLAANSNGAEELNFGHDHNDDLGFWLYGNGQWLAPETPGYKNTGNCYASLPAVWDTSYHNSFTVDGVGQISDDLQCRDSAHVPWTRKSSVTAHTGTRAAGYVALEGAALYPSSLGLDTARREVLFVDRACVVTRDTLHAAQPHVFQWHAHALDAVMRDGDWIRAESKQDQSLGVRVVAPAQWTMAVTSDSVPHGPNAGEYIDPDLTISHYRVDAPPSQGARFLMVMCPTTTSAWAARPHVSPLGDAAAARGFVLDRAGLHERWLFGELPTATVTDGADLSLTGVAGGVEEGGGGTTYLLVRGSALTGGGHDLLISDAAAGSIEARVAGASVDVSADGPTTARLFAPGATSATWNGVAVPLAVDQTDPRFVILGGPLPNGGDGSVTGGSDGGGIGGGSDGGTSAGSPDGGRGGSADVMGGCSVASGRPSCATPSLLALLFLLGGAARRRRQAFRPSRIARRPSGGVHFSLTDAPPSS